MQDFVDPEVILKLEEDLANRFNGSKAIADKILANEFIEYGSSGTIYNKQQTLDIICTVPDSYYQITDFSARPLASGLVLATYTASRYSLKTQREMGSSRRSSIWQLIDNQWQLLFHQGTKIF